jgi:hypothetical protein
LDSAFASHVPHKQHEPGRLRIRQRLKHDGIEDTEDCRVGADAKGQRQRHKDRKTRAPPQRSRRVSQILRQNFHPSERPHIAAYLLPGCRPAKLAARDLSRLVRAHTLLPVTVGALIEMKADFFFEVAVQTSSLEKRPAAEAKIG